jgi:NADPH:quinone reductase-like Zn-dependent oxidoreductase
VSSEVRERLAALAADLAALGELRRDEPMSRHTTFGIGGPADLFFRATGRQTLAGAVRAARRRGVALTILGSGSNVLVGDRGIRGLVVVNEARASPARRAGSAALATPAWNGRSAYRAHSAELSSTTRAHTAASLPTR